MLTHQLPDELRARIVELESSVDLRFSRHRGLVGGVEVGDTEIKRILRQSDDPAERREAWEASKTVGAEVADDVRELARLRNEAARALGHRDWFALSLSTDELDEQKLIDTLAEADRVTAEPFARWKSALDERLAARFGCAVSELRPWHYADPVLPGDASGRRRRPRPAVRRPGRRRACRAARSTGSGSRSTRFSRGAISTRATARTSTRSASTSTGVATSASSRTPCPTHDSADTMLHELGHGVYDLGFRDDLPWLLRSTHLVATEASALLFGALSWRARVARARSRS